MVSQNKGDINKHRIGIFGKGGSGKSTIAVLFSQALQMEDYQVILLDADSTNTGMDRVLGLDRTPEPLLDYFGGMVFSGGKVTCPVDDPAPLAGSRISLNQLPGQYYVSSGRITLLIAGKIGDQSPGAGCDGPIAKIARDVRFDLEGGSTVTVIDFKAGFEDSARGVLTSLDWIIVVIDPTIAAIEMAANMENMVACIQAGELPATKHLESLDMVSTANRFYQQSMIKGVLTILNKVEDPEMEDYMRTEILNRGLKPCCVIHTDPELSKSWLIGKPIDTWRPRMEVHKLVSRLEKMRELQEVESAVV